MKQAKNITTRKRLAAKALELADTIRAIKKCDYEHDATELFDASDATALKAIAKELHGTCGWRLDDDGCYQTDCGNYFESSGSATDHKQQFCGFCGGVMDDKYTGGAK
jgi:hypothetical protein